MPTRSFKRQRRGRAPTASEDSPTLEGNELLALYDTCTAAFPADMVRLLDPDLPGGQKRRAELFEHIEESIAVRR